MSDLEEVIRETLAARALQAPDADALVDSVRGRRGHRRAAGTLIAVAAVAAATTSAVVLPLTLPGHNTARPPHKPAPAPASTGQIIGFHGIEITVPTTWKINVLTCGTPVADTVVRDYGAMEDCKIGTPAHVSSVWLGTIIEPFRFFQHDQFINAHGVQIQRGTTKGGTATTLVIRRLAVDIQLETTPVLAARIIDSIRIVDTDVTGCPMHQDRLDPPRLPDNPDVLGAPVIFPSGPTSIAICHYADYWLVSSATATGPAAADIVRVADSVRSGWVHGRRSGPASTCTEAEPGPPAGQGYVLFAHYTRAPTLTAWAHIGLCGRLGITNGSWVGQLTTELAGVITRPLHNGYEMPGSLLPGPG